MAKLDSTTIYGSLLTTGNAIAQSFIKSGGTSDDVLLGDGTTTSLAGLGGGGGTYTSSNGILLTGSNFTPTYGTAANTIAQGNDSRINNGQTAFGWGNHSGLYLPKAGGQMSGSIERLSAITGYQIGSYNTSGANSTNSNPIYTIGSLYQPASTTLGNMYGIGYTNTAASFINVTDAGSIGAAGWGMYVAAVGIAKIWLNSQDGTGHFKGDLYSNGAIQATQAWVTAQGYGTGGGTADGNNYLTGVSGSGNGTVTFTRTGLANLTWNAAHSHTYNSFGIENTSQTSGNGISLYGGASSGKPSYGLMFTGTASHGTYGGVSGDWATYFTVDGVTTRGWIFKHASTNIASISGTGIATFAGNVNAPDFVGTSDITLKENIKTLSPKPINTQYKTFNFIGNEQPRVGVIAQELEVHHPEFVRTNNEGIKSVSYNDLHSAEIAYLKVENKRLNDKNKELENKLNLVMQKLGL